MAAQAPPNRPKELLCHFPLWAEGLVFLLLEVGRILLYYKTMKGTILAGKSTGFPQWVQWIHHDEGETHCEICLKLDGCYFTEDRHPPCPHHPFCHCTLEPIDFAIVRMNAVAKRQGLEKYVSGDYQLGKLNKYGQHISIRVSISRRDNGNIMSFATGWVVHPKGTIQLATPYGGE